MKDSRLIWLKKFFADKDFAIVASSALCRKCLKPFISYIKAEGSPEVIENLDSRTFVPLSSGELQHVGSNALIYLISCRKSSVDIKRKLMDAGQFLLAEYTVLPGWRNPRWFIPVWRLMGPGNLPRMIQPSHLLSKIAVFLFRLLKAIKIVHLFFADRVIVACRNQNPSFFEPQSSFIHFFQNPGRGEQTGVLYTGSFGPLQKFTVEVLRNEKVFAYAKFGHNQYTQKAIDNEQNTLRKLSTLQLTTVRVPELAGYDLPRGLSEQTIIVKTLDGGKRPTQITDVIIDGLAELYNLTHKVNVPVRFYLSMQLNKLRNQDFAFLDQECKQMTHHILSLLDQIDSQINETDMLPLSLSHGDFTRWNVRTDDINLYVIDWEEADMRPPGHDLLSFLWAEWLLVQSFDPKKIARLFCREVEVGVFKKYLLQINCSGQKEILFGFLFIISVLNSSLWHSCLHERLDYPKKTNLQLIIKTAYLSLQVLEVKSHDLSESPQC